MKNKILLVISLSLILIAANTALSKNKIFKVDIGPLNRTIIYCTENPANYSAELSNDKKSIVMKINDCSLENSNNKIISDGIIKEINLVNFKNFTQINIKLNDKRGFSTITLPYTNSILLDVFDWKAISTSEDDYRCGLLALESKNYTLSKKYFENSAKSGNEWAHFQLGLMYIKTGNYDLALVHINKAENLGLTLPDIYGALSQIYFAKNNKSKADNFKKLFIEKSSVKNLKYIITDNSTTNDSLNYDTNSLISIFSDSSNSKVDSVKAKVMDTVKSNKVNSPEINNGKNEDFNKKFLTNNTNHSSFDYLRISLYLFGFVGIILILILISYFKWRAIKAKELKMKKTAQKFNKDLKIASKDIYSKNKNQRANDNSGNLINKVINDEDNSLADSIEKYNLTYPMNKPKPKEKSQNKVYMLAQEIINSKKNIENNFDEEIKLQERKVEPVMKNDEESINLILNRISDLTTDYNLDKAVDKARREHDMNDGKYNLAIKLQHHQNEKKLKRLEELNVNDFSLDSKSLVDNAKFLGLERAGVETKKGLSDLVSDKTRLMKLSEKFFVNSK